MISEQDIRKLSDIEDMSDRLEAAARLTSGDIVEIGGGEGVNTLRFLKIAKEREATVIVVDPFEQITGADESYFKPYNKEKFLKTVEQYAADLVLMELPSQHDQVKSDLMWFKPVGLMFIDGLQDKESVLSDLILAQNMEAEIICVDDYDRLTESSQVPLAVIEFLKATMYKIINIGKREVYFIR